MDWSKSKNILILALLATNIFLLISLLDPNDFFGDDSLQETLSYLQNNGVNISESVLQSAPKEMGKLKVQYSENPSADVEESVRRRQHKIDPDSTDEEYAAAALVFLNELGVYGETVELDQVEHTEEGQVIVKYANFYGRFQLEESFMHCFFEEGRLVGFRRNWLEPLSQENKNEIVDVQKALRWFVSELENESTVTVTDVRLIYYLEPRYDLSPGPGNLEDNPTIDTAFPYWKITYLDGEGNQIIWRNGAYDE